MFPALSSEIILGLDTIFLVNEMEGIGVINVLLWAWNRSWLSFPDAINLPQLPWGCGSSKEYGQGCCPTKLHSSSTHYHAAT